MWGILMDHIWWSLHNGIMLVVHVMDRNRWKNSVAPKHTVRKKENKDLSKEQVNYHFSFLFQPQIATIYQVVMWLIHLNTHNILFDILLHMLLFKLKYYLIWEFENKIPSGSYLLKKVKNVLPDELIRVSLK